MKSENTVYTKIFEWKSSINIPNKSYLFEPLQAEIFMIFPFKEFETDTSGILPDSEAVYHGFPVKLARGQIVPSQIGPSQIGHIFQIE